LLRDGLKGSVRYYDGFTNDARLVIDTLRSAEEHGAAVINYCRFQDAERADLWNCQVQDLVSGQGLGLQARAVVNATGPWADGLPHSHVQLRLTKGIHIVVDRSRLPAPETVVMTEGKRILFAIPWGERTIIGTTDTDYNGSLEDVRADASDIQYVLKIANSFFPEVKLAPSEIISAWAGLRPLLADPNGNPSDISRSHEIKNPEPFWWDVAGGKLTTYRLMAEQTVDEVVKKINVSKDFGPCKTADEALLPETETKGISGIVPPEPGRSIVEHFCAREWTLHLDDLMVRRTSWHYYRRDASKLAEQVAEWMAELLDWTGEQRASELERYQRLSHRAPSSDRKSATESSLAHASR
jgi:glycerol-3-phosphate dehydrogenase